MGIHAQGIAPQSSQLLGFLKGADMNSTADQAIKMSSANYIVDKIIVTNPSTSLGVAVGGVYPAASKAGTPIVAATQVYSALTAAAKLVALTLAAIAGTDRQTATTLYLSLTVAQGGAATADIYVYGTPIN